MRRLLIEVRWLAECAGYWIRPYDMLADARRWRWQRAQQCAVITPDAKTGQWVARTRSGQILATAPTAYLIVAKMTAAASSGATAKFERGDLG